MDIDAGDIATYEAPVYSRANQGAVTYAQVAREVWPYYCRLGAEASWLGFPIKPAQRSSVYRAQYFEKGAVYWKSGTDPIAVPKATVDFMLRVNRRGRLGNPVSEEQPVGADGSGRIQFFENGVITLRNGERQIWLRPEPTTDSTPDRPAPERPASVEYRTYPFTRWRKKSNGDESPYAEES